MEFNQTEYEGRTLRINLSADRQQQQQGERRHEGKNGAPREDRPKADPSNQIVLRNLSFDTTEDTIRETFGECGMYVL